MSVYGDESDRESVELFEDREEGKLDGLEKDDGEAVQIYDFKNLPPYACSYCGIHDMESVAKCIHKNCNQWFCNNKEDDISKGSHLILHLVKAKHKEVCLHPDNSLGVSTLECYVCGNRNVFLLGFVPLQDSQVAIVCRMPCLYQANADLNWNANDFCSLIEEKAFLTWLLKPSPNENLRRARKVNMDQINKIEELRKENPDVKFEDIMDKPKEKKLKEVLLRYRDGDEYLDVFLPLIKAEAAHDKKIKESQTQSGIKIRWETSIKNNKKLAYFVFSSKEDFETNLLPGNELKISCKNPNWSAKGHVTRITTSKCQPY
jgi:regulator of nonsense transcripts 1